MMRTTGLRKTLFVVLLLGAVAPAWLHGQQKRSDLGSFLIEAAAAAAGSGVGFSLTKAALSECGVDDLACDIGHVAAATGVATAGAAAGAYFIGKWADTNPSGAGAILGAVAGAFAGIGAWHFINEEVNVNTSDAASIAIYAVTQGLVTALGSRLVRKLKD